MTEQKDGGPAFPALYSGEQGMTLRDWFAGQALAGLLANNETSNAPSIVSDCALKMADAMIAARKAKL